MCVVFSLKLLAALDGCGRSSLSRDGRVCFMHMHGEKQRVKLKVLSKLGTSLF